MFKDDLNVPRRQDRKTSVEILHDLRSLKSSEASLILKNESLQMLGMLKLDRSHICGKLPLKLPKGGKI